LFQRVPTGLPQLDDVIEGGLPKAGLFLVAGTSGSGKTAFSARFLYEGNVVVSIVRPFSNTLRELASASDVHLRLAQYDGVLCLLGVKPGTDYYDVSHPDNGSHAYIELVQVF
jgi:RecA/RadA recombinase